jgi:hypothetical protein
MIRVAVFAMLASALLVSARAAGAPPSGAPPDQDLVELRWEAPAGCPPADEIRAGIAHGLAAARAPVAPMRASAIVSQLAPEQWRVALDLRGVDWTATRTLKGPSCVAVSDAAALLIVMAINTEIEETQPRLVAPPPVAPPVWSPLPADGPLVSLAAALDGGALPGVAAGGAVAAGWRFTHVRLDLGASLFYPRRGTVPGTPDTGARFHLASADARGCYLVGLRWSLGPCATAGLNRTQGQGFGPNQPSDKVSTTGTLGGQLLAEWRLSRWVVPYFSAGVVIPLVRPTFSVKDIGLVHRAAPAFFRAAAGFELRFR